MVAVKYKNYTTEALKNAIEDTAKGTGLRKAAGDYGISPATLWRHARGQLTGHPVRMLTTTEEMALVTYIKYSQVWLFAKGNA